MTITTLFHSSLSSILPTLEFVLSKMGSLLRVCNTGVTAVIDRFGRTVSRFGSGHKASETSQGVLSAALPLEFHKTIYMFWGDFGIVGLALISLLFFAAKQPQEFALEENGSVS